MGKQPKLHLNNITQSNHAESRRVIRKKLGGSLRHLGGSQRNNKKCKKQGGWVRELESLLLLKKSVLSMLTVLI